MEPDYNLGLATPLGWPNDIPNGQPFSVCGLVSGVLSVWHAGLWV